MLCPWRFGVTRLDGKERATINMEQAAQALDAIANVVTTIKDQNLLIAVDRQTTVTEEINRNVVEYRRRGQAYGIGCGRNSVL